MTNDTRPDAPAATGGERCNATYTYYKVGRAESSCPCVMVGPHDQHECEHGATWGYVHVESETQAHIDALESALAARDATIRDLVALCDSRLSSQEQEFRRAEAAEARAAALEAKLMALEAYAFRQHPGECAAEGSPFRKLCYGCEDNYKRYDALSLPVQPTQEGGQ